MLNLAQYPAVHKPYTNFQPTSMSSRCRTWAMEQYPRRLAEALATGGDEEALAVGLARARAIVVLLEADLAHLARLH